MAGRAYHAWEDLTELGYRDMQLNDTSYKVSYTGYGIPSSQCEEFATMRAAEIATQRGFKYFKITNEKNSSTSQSYYIAQPAQTTGKIVATSSTTARFKGTTTGGAITGSVDRPTATITISLTNQSDENAIDANMIFNSLSAQYGTKK